MPMGWIRMTTMMTGIERGVRKALCKLLLDEHLNTAQRLEALKLATEWAKLQPGKPPVAGMGDARQSRHGLLGDDKP